VGQTTNENSKWTDVRDWYRRQQKTYKQALREGRVQPKKTVNHTTNHQTTVETPVVTDDADVTCTPGMSSTSLSLNKDIDNDDNAVDLDPGPIPKNRYDRGLFENWKEVFFPISLRKEAVSLGGYTKIPPRTGGPPPRTQQKQPQQPPPLQHKTESVEIAASVVVMGGGTKPKDT
jgi:hypothetical protein